MVAVVKSEWHQVERRYGFELTREFLQEVYPELELDEIDLMYVRIEAGEHDINEVLDDAWNENVDIDWDWLDEDDWWTDRKGGYDVTYEVDATREFAPQYYSWKPPKLPKGQESADEEMFPPMDPDDLAQRLEELKIEFDFLCEIENFKNDESIHQEIRDAFVKIIDEEDF